MNRDEGILEWTASDCDGNVFVSMQDGVLSLELDADQTLVHDVKMDDIVVNRFDGEFYACVIDAAISENDGCATQTLVPVTDEDTSEAVYTQLCVEYGEHLMKRMKHMLSGLRRRTLR
jgi:hypothetical protein